MHSVAPVMAGMVVLIPPSIQISLARFFDPFCRPSHELFRYAFESGSFRVPC